MTAVDADAAAASTPDIAEIRQRAMLEAQMRARMSALPRETPEQAERARRMARASVNAQAENALRARAIAAARRRAKKDGVARSLDSGMFEIEDENAVHSHAPRLTRLEVAAREEDNDRRSCCYPRAAAFEGTATS
jgi:hypothetical protein